MFLHLETIYMVSAKSGTKRSYTTEEPKPPTPHHKSHLQNTKHRVGFVSAHRERQKGAPRDGRLPNPCIGKYAVNIVA